MGESASDRGARLQWTAILVGLTIVAAGSLFFTLKPAYWRFPDPDLILVYHAMIMAGGLPQEFFDHTGYVFLLILSGCYRLLHTLGLLKVHSISALPPPTDRAAFDAAWQDVVQAARVFMTLTAIVYVLVFASLMRRLFSDWRVGAIAGLLLAAALGTLVQQHLVRTELLSSLFVATAALTAAIAGRERAWGPRLAWLVISGACAALALETKVQALLPLLALPPLVAILGTPDAAPRISTRALTLLALAAAVLVYLAARLMLPGLHYEGVTLYPYAPIGVNLSRVYQFLLILWVLAGVGAYAVLWRCSWTASLASAAALGIGFSLGFFVLQIDYSIHNVIAVANPVEHMFVFAVIGYEKIQSQVLGEPLLLQLARNIVAVLKLHAKPFSSGMVLLDWLILIGMLLGWRDRDRRWMLQALSLVITAWVVYAAFLLRHPPGGPTLLYAAFVDPFVIWAAVIVFVRWQAVLLGGWVRLLTAALLVLYLAIDHRQVVRWASFWPDPSTTCEWHPNTFKRLPPFPFCKT